MNYYDLVIVGAGPAGIALAHCCSNLNKKILIIEREESIGGCHRVKRVNGKFTEHGPRIYLNNYVNLFHLISEIGLDKNEVFVPYNFDVYNNKIMYQFTWNEIRVIISTFIKYLIDNDYGKNINLKTYFIKNNFSPNGLDIIDRVCRIIDGATIEKYSVNTLMNMFDSIIGILQPSDPLDNILFKPWQQYLSNKNQHFYLNQELSHINYNKNTNKIDYIIVNDQKIYLDKLVLAIPPASISNVLEKNKHIKDCFGDFNKFNEWVKKTEYIEYISITYHYNEYIKLPIIQGLTFDTDWGILAINLSDYMENIEDDNNTIISIAVTICDKPSKFTGKTANQSSALEVQKEVYRQLKKSLYPDLPDNYNAIINPNNYYKNNKWNNKDSAYFNTINTQRIPFQSKIIPNIYNVGSQNGESYIEYTTMECAVSNGISLALELYPQLKSKYSIIKYWKLSDYIYIILLIILLILIIIMIRYLL
jgi:hypothetical protein